MPSVLPIVIFPDDCLKRKSELVTEVTPEIRAFCEDLVATAKSRSDCAGLAAPQLGVNKRIIVVFFEKKKPLIMLNPKAIAPEGVDGKQYTNHNQVVKEGCLSFPGTWREIARPYLIGLEYQDLNLVTHKRLVSGFFSTLVQHEIDHLDGVVFTSYPISRSNSGRVM